MEIALDTAVALLVAGALAMVAFSNRELRAARIMFALAAGTLIARWLMWGFDEDHTWIVRSTAGAVIGALVLGGLPALWSWTKSKESAQSTPARPNELLFPEQFAQINKLSQFLVGKDETALRQLFDFPEMVRFNILLAKRSLSKKSVSNEELEAPRCIF